MVLGRVDLCTGVDFSVCVVAPPGERSVGQPRGSGAEGVGVSVERPGRTFVCEHRVGFPARLFGLRRCAHVEP